MLGTGIIFAQVAFRGFLSCLVSFPFRGYFTSPKVFSQTLTASLAVEKCWLTRSGFRLVGPFGHFCMGKQLNSPECGAQQFMVWTVPIFWGGWKSKKTQDRNKQGVHKSLINLLFFRQIKAGVRLTTKKMETFVFWRVVCNRCGRISTHGFSPDPNGGFHVTLTSTKKLPKARRFCLIHSSFCDFGGKFCRKWWAAFVWFYTWPKDHWTLQWKGLNLFIKGRGPQNSQFWRVRILRVYIPGNSAGGPFGMVKTWPEIKGKKVTSK